MYTVPAFGPWTEKDHLGEKQANSLKAAASSELTPVQLNKEAQTGEFVGSGKKAYHVTLSSCTCSVGKRGIPCKHIYRLAMELGIIGLPFKAGVPKGVRNAQQKIDFAAAVSALEALSVSAQREIQNHLEFTHGSKDPAVRFSAFTIKGVELAGELRQCMILEERPAPIDDILSKYKKSDLLALIPNCISVTPPPPHRKIRVKRLSSLG